MVKENLRVTLMYAEIKSTREPNLTRRETTPVETVNDFIMAIYALIEHCQYGELSKTMIRNRMAVGIMDANLAEKLHLDSNLILETAIAKAC